MVVEAAVAMLAVVEIAVALHPQRRQFPSLCVHVHERAEL